MQREAEVVHAVVAVGETEIDVATAEGDGLRGIVALSVAADDRRVVDGLAASAFQHAALQPYLIGTGKYGDIVEQDGVVAQIGEQQQTGSGVEEGLQRAAELLQLVELDMLGGNVVDVVEITVVLLVGDAENLGHRLEDGFSLQTIVAAELHQTQQEQRLLRRANVAVKCRTDTADSSHRVQVVAHLIGHSHIAVEVEIEVDVTDTKMTTQIADEHVFCPLLIHLFLFAEEGK